MPYVMRQGLMGGLSFLEALADFNGWMRREPVGLLEAWRYQRSNGFCILLTSLKSQEFYPFVHGPAP